MNRMLATVAFMLAGAVAAGAQDRDPRGEELRREFQRSMQNLEKKFKEERARLEQEFRRAMERLGDGHEKKHPDRKHPDKKHADKPHPEKHADKHSEKHGDKHDKKHPEKKREEHRERDHHPKAEEFRRRHEEHRERSEEFRRRAEREFGEDFRRSAPPDFGPRFREFMEKFRNRGERREGDPRESLQEMLRRIQEQLHQLEKRLEGMRPGDAPRFREFEKFMPKDFKFDFDNEEFRRFMPRFRGEDRKPGEEGKPRQFRFEFRVPPERDDDRRDRDRDSRNL